MFPLSQPRKISVSMSRGRSLALLALAGFACATILSVASFAQSGFATAGDPPLTFGSNYFVTGDYVVAGAQGLNASFGGDGLGTGIISFPDGNRGIRGTTTVPKNANILAALLYWQTVEKVGVPGSGQNGFFRPVFKGGPAKGYPISGLSLPNHNNTSFSNGGCSGTSTGKLVQTYRTDVRGYLPVDANGNVLVDNADGVTFEVRLPNVGNQTPLTLGATLVLIFRVINSPNLNVITIYDGGFAPNTTPNFTMSQPVQGFYQADVNPKWRLTHIVGAGKSNKFQQAYLGGGQGGNQRVPTALPSPYGNGQPAFPGWYGNWDNTTWVSSDLLANPLQDNDDTANASVVASGGNPGCVSWGAVIVSTTVHDDDKDGILQVWKTDQGYTDVGTGQKVSLADLNDPPATGHQDIFIQMDHVVALDVNGNPVLNGDSTPDPLAVNAVKSAFANHNIHLHIKDALQITGIPGANAIPEQACSDTDPKIAPNLCPYPNQPGITTWRDGFELVKNQPLNYPTEADCEANSPPLVSIGLLNCVRRFPPQQRNSHHYVVWGDTLGGPNWTFLGGRLTNSTPGGTGAGMVSQTGSTVTFYTTRGHGLVALDKVNGNGRVTIANAITNPNLNGTYIVQSVKCQTNPDTNTPNDCSTSNRALGPYTFTISIGGSTPTSAPCPKGVPGAACYTLQTDPYLSVASGQAGAGSGFSDVGGDGTLVTLFQWGANATVSAKKGTLLHELGHTLGRLHGGSDNINCKSNYQSVMNYMFQAHLLGPSAVLDLSSQQLSTLDETSLGKISTLDMSPIAITTTKWYDTKPTFAPVPITGATESGFLVTITTTSALGLVPGQSVTISGVGITGYNGTFTVVSVPNSTQFTYNAGVSGLAPSGGGTADKSVAATSHCDGTSLSTNDLIPYYKYSGGTLKFPYELDIPWSTTSLDANFEGNLPGNELHPFNGYNDWAHVDLRQVGAGGNEFFSVPGGFIPGGPGGFIPGGPGGFIPGGPGGFIPGGPGGFIPGGPGGFIPGGPGISGGGSVELDFATATSTIDPPTNLTASEEPSPRIIDLSWDTITFPQINKYNIYRSADQGATFSFLKSVSSPPAQDTTATCNPGGYQYFVTAVFTNTAQITSFSITSNVVTFQAANSFTAGTTVQISGLSSGTYLNGQVLTVASTNGTQFTANFTHANVPSTADSGTAVNAKESAGSNTASTGQNGEPLTGCYLPPVFSLPVAGSSPQTGSTVTVKWTVQDASNKNGVTFANKPGSNTLVVIGPISNDVACVAGIPPGTARSTISSGGTNITFDGTSQFTFNWNTNLGFSGGGAFPPGCYRLELDLDSGQPTSGNLPTSRFQVQFYLSDSNESVLIKTTSPLPDAIVGVPYSQPLLEMGGVVPLSWTVSSGSLPPGTPASLTLNAGSGLLSGTPSAAGTYNFTAQVTDSIGDFGTQPLTLTVHIFVSDSQPPANPPFTATTTLPNAVVGSPYSNTVYESGGVSNNTTAFSWTIVPNSVMPGGGSTLPGLAFQPNAIGVTNGTLSGTPTTTGTFTFTAKVTDSAGNTGTQTLTLNVVDALFGDLIVVDGSPSANGTLFRITPDGTVRAAIANISNGSPTGVAVDPSGGNIYVAVAGLGGNGTPSVVKVTQFGATSNFVSGGVLQNPVAVAVDASGNVYVGDNKTDAIYKFNSSGTQVGPSPFASLPSSPNTLQDIRMAFNSTGNLIVASDSVGDVSGVVEVDTITPTGAFSVLYNTLTNSTLTDALTAVSNASGGNTTYTGTFSPILPAGSAVTITGFTNAGNNNGQFTIVSCTSTQLVVNNPAGMAETNPGTATFNPSGLSLAIGTVGGIAAFSDGSIDVADFAAKSIFKITAPGTATMAITTAISGPATLCCNISGMANPPSQQANTTDLYVTLNGVGGPAAQLQLAVPETGKVTTVVSGAPLTFPNDVASYSFPGVTYYIDGNSNFGILNLGNGSTKVIGAGTVLGTGIDLTPTGQVYVDDFSNNLQQMNTSTGVATLVGTGSIPANDFFTTGGLTNGSYFAVDASSGNLYSINLSTGATTLVGLTGTATIPPNCGVETTMAGSATVLYYTIGLHNTRQQICSSPMPDTLYQINPTTGATTTIGPVSVSGFVGSGYVNGRLYAFTFDGREYLINTVTGAATFVTNTTPAVFGAGSTSTSLSF
jgi:hypothetical protein